MRTRADSERRPVALLLVRRLRSLREWPTGGGSAFSPFFFFFYFPPHTFFWELAQLWRLRNDAVYIHPLTDRTRSIGRRQQESKKRKKKHEAKGENPEDYCVIEQTDSSKPRHVSPPDCGRDLHSVRLHYSNAEERGVHRLHGQTIRVLFSFISFSHFSYSGKDCICDQNIGGKIVAHYGNSCQSNLSVFRLCVFALHVH